MPAVNRCSISLARSSRPSSRIVSSTARAAAAAIGLPPKVEPWEPACISSAVSPKASVAPIGRPPPSAFARVMTSGATPSAWCMNHEPVRPMPVCTSSTANRAPASAVVAAAAARYPAGAGSTPPSPSIGSSSTIAVCPETAPASASASP